MWWSNGDLTFTVTTRTLIGGFQPFSGDFDGDGIDDIFSTTPRAQTGSAGFVPHCVSQSPLVRVKASSPRFPTCGKSVCPRVSNSVQQGTARRDFSLSVGWPAS